jgi:hypothetical protein
VTSLHWLRYVYLLLLVLVAGGLVFRAVSNDA